MFTSSWKTVSHFNFTDLPFLATVCFITGPLSLFCRVIISILRIPSKTGLVLLRKDWKKWKKVTCQLQSYTWRLLFYRNPTMQRYSLMLLLIKKKGTPFSTQWWNDFKAQTFVSHNWLKQIECWRQFWNSVCLEIDKGDLFIRWSFGNYAISKLSL